MLLRVRGTETRSTRPAPLSPRFNTVSSPAANASSGASLRGNLRCMTGDGFFHALMQGMGETYLPAFVLLMGMGEVAAGMIASVPMLAGALLQLLTPWGVGRLGSHKRWVVTCASIQGLSFFPLAWGAMTGTIATWQVFAVAAMYWGFGMATGPAWNTWVETIVPGKVRPGYFANRTRICQTGILIGFVVGGISLQWTKAYGNPMTAFLCLFLTAGVCRLVSAFCLSRQSESPAVSAAIKDRQAISFSEFLSRVARGGPERLLVCLMSIQMMVYISGPYFNPFMLKQLGFSYQDYVILIAASFLSKALSMSALGGMARRLGTQRLLWIGAAGIVPLSGMWVFSNSFWYLLFVQLAGGFFWAAYELAVALMLFEMIPRRERTGVLTIYNAGNAAAMVLGSLVGGGILQCLGERPETYLVIFACSSLGRFGVLCLLTAVGFPVKKGAEVPVIGSNAVVRPARLVTEQCWTNRQFSPQETNGREELERLPEVAVAIIPVSRQGIVPNVAAKMIHSLPPTKAG